uniref:Ubiquitin conjugating enzyme E2 E2 n=1 Tax=Bos indicus x Bos taurus TaxID=30522 RepID=A0A4W2H0Y0_BOBOX
MSTEAQRVDDSPGTSGGSSDGDQRESVQQEPEREQVQPKKKEGKISSKTAAKLSTSAKRIQKELAEITLDPPPNCRLSWSFPDGTSSKRTHLPSRRRKKVGFDPWVGKIPCSRRWPRTPGFLPGESHGRGAWRSTVSGVTESRTRLKRLSPTRPDFLST